MGIRIKQIVRGRDAELKAQRQQEHLQLRADNAHAHALSQIPDRPPVLVPDPGMIVIKIEREVMQGGVRSIDTSYLTVQYEVMCLLVAVAIGVAARARGIVGV